MQSKYIQRPEKKKIWMPPVEEESKQTKSKSEVVNKDKQSKLGKRNVESSSVSRGSSQSDESPKRVLEKKKAHLQDNKLSKLGNIANDDKFKLHVLKGTSRST